MPSHFSISRVNSFLLTTPIRHDKGRCHGENLAALLKTKPATAQLLFTRKIGEAVEGIAPSKGLRKQFGRGLVAFLKPALRIEAISDKLVILGLT